MTVFVALSALAFIMLSVPMYQHIKNRNIPACVLMGWLMVSNLCGMINAILWPSYEKIYTAYNGHIYCDIAARINFTAGAGQVGALAAIARNLAMIMSDRSHVSFTKSEKRRRLAIDLSLCFVMPIWYNLVYYVVQRSRYSIVAVTGCLPVVDSSWLSVLLIFIWPPIFSILAGYYAGLVIWRMKKYRKEFSIILRNNRSNTSKSRFIRLFMLAFILIVMFLPVNFFVFVEDVMYSHHAFSWKEVHGPYWHIILRLAEAKPSVFLRWYTVVGAFLSTMISSIGTEATIFYRQWAKKLGLDVYLPGWCWGPRKKSSQNTSKTSSSNGPSYWGKTYFSSFSLGSKAEKSRNESVSATYLQSKDYSNKEAVTTRIMCVSSPGPAIVDLITPAPAFTLASGCTSPPVMSSFNPRTFSSASRQNDTIEASDSGIYIAHSYNVQSSPDFMTTSRASRAGNEVFGDGVPLRNMKTSNAYIDLEKGDRGA